MEKRRRKKALDISYDMLEQMEVGICLLKESLKVWWKKGIVYRYYLINGSY